VSKQSSGLAADARALSTYVKLLRAGEGVLRESSRLLALYDLTPTQFGVLESLHQAGRQDLPGLAQGLLRSSGDLSAAVEALRKRGLIRRGAGARDRRSASIALTPKGRNLVQSVLPGHGAAIVGVMARLSPREQEALSRLCQKLGHPAARSAAKPAGRGRGRARSSSR
jgi:MarR family transcriptional regulator, 2-MHQ and catechol-resistance regulon repressor